jgi:hypothetical protein
MKPDRSLITTVLTLVGAVVIVSLAPVIVTGIMGKVIPDGLIGVSDKTVTGLIGVLGTVVGWRAAKDRGADV